MRRGHRLRRRGDARAVRRRDDAGVRRPRPSPDSDGGAVAVVVALTLTLLMGFAALAVDAGQLWTQRRALVKATDAAALDAAQQAATGSGACAVVPGRLAANTPADAAGCTQGSAGAASWVRVEASRTVDFAFAPVFGAADTVVNAASTARWGTAAAATGLRPFGACALHPDLQQVAAGGPGGPIRLEIEPGPGTDGCAEDAPGQFLWWDFDGGANATSQLRAWLLDGYDGEIAVGDEVEGDPGRRAALESTLRILADRGLEVVVPLYDDLRGPGANARYRVAGFLGAVVTDAKIGGAGTDYVEIQPVRTLVQGTCCGPPGADFGVATIGLCAVDGMDPTVRCRP